MKITEFLTESSIHPGIVTVLTQKGYRPLGEKGADQQAFLEPGTGLVLKIFGTSNDFSSDDFISAPSGFDYYSEAKSPTKANVPIQLTDAQKTFKGFADFCMAHKGNQYLPQFFGWETFIFEGKQYLQIRMERLFEFKGHSGWAEVLEAMADAVVGRLTMDGFISTRIKYSSGDEDDPDALELFTHLGKDGIKLLWTTIEKLRDMARRYGWQLDLHSGNFMLGSDGEIVISDPFWSGTF